MADGGIRQHITMMYAPATWEHWVNQARTGAGGRLQLGPMKLLLSTVTGRVQPDAAQLIDLFDVARRVGTGVALHIADEGMLAVGLYAADRVRRRGWDLPIRFEHVPICPPDLASELARLEVTVVTQPGFLLASGDRYLQDVEPHLQQWLYPIRSLLERGVRVRAGSDAPVGPVDPRRAMRTAVTRMT